MRSGWQSDGVVDACGNPVLLKVILQVLAQFSFHPDDIQVVDRLYISYLHR